MNELPERVQDVPSIGVYLEQVRAQLTPLCQQAVGEALSHDAPWWCKVGKGKAPLTTEQAVQAMRLLRTRMSVEAITATQRYARRAVQLLATNSKHLEAWPYAEAAVIFSQDDAQRAYAWLQMGCLFRDRGFRRFGERGMNNATESAAKARNAGLVIEDPNFDDHTLVNLCEVYAVKGNLPQAKRLAFAIYADSQDLKIKGYAADVLGQVAKAEGKLLEAIERFAEAVSLFQQVDLSPSPQDVAGEGALMAGWSLIHQHEAMTLVQERRSEGLEGLEMDRETWGRAGDNNEPRDIENYLTATAAIYLSIPENPANEAGTTKKQELHEELLRLAQLGFAQVLQNLGISTKKQNAEDSTGGVIISALAGIVLAAGGILGSLLPTLEVAGRLLRSCWTN